MKLKSLIKVLLSLAMLGLVLSTVDFEKLKTTIMNLPLSIVGLIFAGYIGGQFLSSAKWWLIAKNGGIDVSYSTALKSYFIGMFVNCFGFGVVGGDVTRGLLLSHGKPQKTPAIASVIADRLHGLAVLSLLCMFSWLIVDHDNMNPSLKTLLASVIAAVIVGWFAGPYLLLKIIPENSKYRRKAEQLCRVFPNNPKFLFLISLISLVFHLTQIWLHWLIGYGFGIYLTWQILLTRIPIVNILTTLPISWNGLGVREKGYSYFLTPQIITQEQAVAFGAIWLLAVTLSSAIGGIISIVTKDFEVISHIEKSEDFSLLEKENV
jgi:uncharacterized protein (TIRG00374 family)